MPIKTFRGLMADDTQDTIVLHTNDGSIGYRIVKFQVMPKTDALVETTMKIYKVPQRVVPTDPLTSDMDFSDNTLLGAAFYAQTASTDANKEVIIFDNEIFNQDIYITLKAHSSAGDMNYYIELEQIKLDLNENTVATLKDIRNLS
jgi:hypothetical protein